MTMLLLMILISTNLRVKAVGMNLNGRIEDYVKGDHMYFCLEDYAYKRWHGNMGFGSWNQLGNQLLKITL